MEICIFYIWIDFSCVYSTRLRATMILYHMLCAIVLLTLCAIATATIERRKKALTIMLQGDKWSNHFKMYLWKYIWSQSCFFLFENQNKTRPRRTITSNRFCMIYEPVKNVSKCDGDDNDGCNSTTLCTIVTCHRVDAMMHSGHNDRIKRIFCNMCRHYTTNNTPNAMKNYDNGNH